MLENVAEWLEENEDKVKLYSSAVGVAGGVSLMAKAVANGGVVKRLVAEAVLVINLVKFGEAVARIPSGE